jgi:hypothetical protein
MTQSEREARREWLRQQATQLKSKRDVEAEAHAAQQMSTARALQEMLIGIAKQNQQNKRLASWLADRCHRITEVRTELLEEWKRRCAAEARVEELERQLAERDAQP